MTWSVSAIGRAPKVREEISRQFTLNKCVEPEESVRQSAAKVIDDALAAQDDNFVVQVSASGSQSSSDWNAKTGVSNSLAISIVPMYGFIG